MSELTKDELRIILLDMDININKAPPLKPSPIYLALRDKVSSIIDNYCDHKITRSRTMNVRACEDCGGIY